MRVIALVLAIPALVVALYNFGPEPQQAPEAQQITVEATAPAPEKEHVREIAGTVRKGESLYDLFRRNGLSITEFMQLKEAAASVHRLKHLKPGRAYTFIIDEGDCVRSFSYWIDDDSILKVELRDGIYVAEKNRPDYEIRISGMDVVIRDNLIASIGRGRQDLSLALQLSDIFAWDLDFTTDLQNGDVFKIIAEELYLDGAFRKYGNVLSAEFIGSEGEFRAYRFEGNGKTGYYDDDGRSVKKAFLKAPLSIRRISSGFSRGRYHPILKKYRPHHGVDYAAPTGTPVAAVGSGTVVFSGRRGQYGKLVILRHRNGYSTRYGHLSRIAKGLRKGAKVEQGDVIGSVGRTGLATGPHLHFEMRLKGKPINPLLANIPRGDSLPGTAMAEFRNFKALMDAKLAAISPPTYAGELEHEEKSKASI